MHNKTLLTVFKIRSEWLVNSVMFIQYSFAQWWSDSREYLSSDGASSLRFVADEIFTIDTISHSLGSHCRIVTILLHQRRIFSDIIMVVLIKLHTRSLADAAISTRPPPDYSTVCKCPPNSFANGIDIMI